MDNLKSQTAFLLLGFESSQIFWIQEEPLVTERDKKDYLRIGNIKLNASLLKLPDSETR
jgi:hypothetical protein